MNNTKKSVNNDKLNKNKNMVISNENNLLKKNVIINEENNEEIIIDEVDYDTYDSTEENSDMEIEEIHPGNDFYFPWYVQAHACAENIDLVRYTKVDNTGDCLFDSLIILTGLNLNIKELRNMLKQSETIELCEKPEQAYAILNTNKAWGNKDIIYIFSENLSQNICVHIYDDKKNNQGNTNITYAHFKANDTDDYIHLHLKSSHYTPLLKIDEIENYDNIDPEFKEIIIEIKANKNYEVPKIVVDSNEKFDKGTRPRRKPPWKNNDTETL